jgi:hypothetical protein
MGGHLRYNLSCTEYPAGKYNYASDATLYLSLTSPACFDAAVGSRFAHVCCEGCGKDASRRAATLGRSLFAKFRNVAQFERYTRRGAAEKTFLPI